MISAQRKENRARFVSFFPVFVLSLHMEHGDGRKKRKEVICTSAVDMHVENYRTIQT